MGFWMILEAACVRWRGGGKYANRAASGMGITTPLQDFKTLYIAVAEPVAFSGTYGLLLQYARNSRGW